MPRITMELPNETLIALRASGPAAGSEIRLAAAMKMYEMGRISSGAAASLAGIPRTVFLSKLADYGIDTFSLTKDDFEKESSFFPEHL
jgi:predicted HTH domain antitoxin